MSPVCSEAAKRFADSICSCALSSPLVSSHFTPRTLARSSIPSCRYSRACFLYPLHLFLPSQVDVDSCDYLLDLDFPQHPREGPHEPRYVADEKTWARVTCQPFLDAAHSPLLTRTLWFPGALWQQENSYGEFCLLRHRANVARKEKEHAVPGA